jgi:membrane protease YdiL (CAAX protease family)
MTAESPSSWHPDPSWADPLIALLAILALLAVTFSLESRHVSAKRPTERAGLQGRILEVTLAGPHTLAGREVSEQDWAKAQAQLKEAWDQALLAVLKTELMTPKGALPQGAEPNRIPPGLAGESFQRLWNAAYAGGPMPDQATRLDLHRRLGGGYAADLIEARLRDREGGGAALRTQARASLLAHLIGLGLLGMLVLALAGGGIAVGIYLLVTREKPRSLALPAWAMSGRAAAIVLLAWFLAFFLSGNVAAILLHPWPRWRWVILPLSYLLHATFGLRLLCKAEGIRFRALWRRVVPGRMGRDLAWGGAFLALALFLVLAVALTSNLVMKPDQSPQRDLQDLLRSLSGWAPNIAMLLTVAGLAPFFEELLFRGFLLPVLARRQHLAVALMVSALLFGAIHLQPAGLPTLCTLGWVLGLAMRQTGSLRTPILVHACWNGGLFLLMRAFA